MVPAFQVLQSIFCMQGNIQECNKFESRGTVFKVLMLVSVNNNGICNMNFLVILFISFCFVTHSYILVTYIKSIRYLRYNMTVVFSREVISPSSLNPFIPPTSIFLCSLIYIFAFGMFKQGNSTRS
jgi:hypothetical protein